jgi:hypothetical protein
LLEQLALLSEVTPTPQTPNPKPNSNSNPNSADPGAQG